MEHRPAAIRHTLAALALAVPGALSAQTYATIPVGSVYAGACTGSSSGGGNQRPGRFDITQHYHANRFTCDVEIAASVASGASSLVAGPQTLDASAEAGFGVARVFAEQHIQSWHLDGLSFPTARGYAGWVDEIRIDAPGLTGQAGSFTAEMRATGTLAAHGYQGIASFRVNQFRGPGFTSETMLFDLTRRDDPAGVVHTIDQIVTTTIPFVYGTPLRYGLFAAAQTMNGSEGGLNHLRGDARSEFDHTVTWVGITAVRLGGATVADYTVTTASGSRWILGPAVVVPEPRTLALVAPGLALVLIGTRAARRRAPR